MCENRKIFILLFGIPILFMGCLNLKHQRENIAFYTLEYNTRQIAKLETFPFVLRIERLSVAPPYNTNLIIYRDEAFKRDAYVYHKWRANPGDLVYHLLGRDIKQAGLFKAVLLQDSRFAASHILEGSVDEFFEWDTKESWQAVLSISITIVAEKEADVNKRVLFQKTYRTTKACEQKNPRALAEAMSLAMAQVSGEIIKDIYESLKGSQ